MKIVFVSNYMNHHQLPLSDALWRKTNGAYTFVTTASMPPERKRLGYPEICRDYILPLEAGVSAALQKIREADVVITGSAPEWLLRERVRSGKLLLRYAERPLKHGPEPLKYPARFLRWHLQNPPGKPIYMLCASAYTARDYEAFGLFRNQTFRWGYFPEQKHYEVQTLLDGKDPAEILWCGRFLPYKHPENAILAAQKLKQKGFCFQLKFMGTGKMEPQLHSMVQAADLEDCVQFLGAGSPETVRCAMEHAGIFLFTSDREEGWGAVLNEAMNSGCAVVASHAAGAVPFLVMDGENGLIYRCEDMQMLLKKLTYLLEQPGQQRRLGAAAYETIQSQWNAETAADRLMALAKNLLEGNGKLVPFSDGPCSRAICIKESWYP